MSDTKRTKSEKRSGNVNTCGMTHLHWMCFRTNSFPLSSSQENHSGPLSDQYLAASVALGKGSKGFGSLRNTEYKKMLGQTLIVLAVPCNGQQRTSSSCTEIIAKSCTGENGCGGQINPRHVGVYRAKKKKNRG